MKLDVQATVTIFWSVCTVRSKLSILTRVLNVITVHSANLCMHCACKEGDRQI